MISALPSSVNWHRRNFRSAMLLNRVEFDTPLGGGPLREQRWEHPPRDPDNALVLADLDPNSTACRAAFHRAASGGKDQ